MPEAERVVRFTSFLLNKIIEDNGLLIDFMLISQAPIPSCIVLYPLCLTASLPRGEKGSYTKAL